MPPRTLAALDEEALVRRIQRHFAAIGAPRWGLAIGDDAALWRPRAGHELVVTTDLAVEGRDFVRPAMTARDVGWRALAQNLSDLAAMGARPVGWLLGLALPPALALAWLDGTLAGMAELAARSGCPLVGGDLSATDGPVTLTITALGEVPRGQALRRDGACAGDVLWVSGTPGRASLGLAAVLGHDRSPTARRHRRTFLRPAPRLALGQALRRIASAGIDLSDGLLRDLGRLARASRVAAHVDSSALPHSPGLATARALTGGEDFELLFTAPPHRQAALRRLSRRLGVPLTPIGRVARGRGVRVDGAAWRGDAGFDHFAPATADRVRGD